MLINGSHAAHAVVSPLAVRPPYSELGERLHHSEAVAMPTVCLVIGVAVRVADVVGALDADEAAVDVMLGLPAVLPLLLLPPFVLLVVLV